MNDASSPPHRWVTMQDVARTAGVSTITVSRVLRTPEKVRAATRDRVQAAVRDLGYVPDQVAGSLSSRESRLVAALVSTLSGSIFASTVDGLARSLREADHQLLLGTTEYSTASEQALIATALSRRPDGIVLTSGEHTPAARAMLVGAGIPVVEVWELPEDPVDMAVGFSNFEAGRAMTRHLHAVGRQRIGFVGGSRPAAAGGDEGATEGDRRGRLRRQGYAAALAELGLGEPRVVPDPAGGSMVERGARDLAALLERWPDTDAVFCSSDSVALGALSEARRRGIAVPDRLAVAGFGDFEFAGDSGLGLTTVSIPGHAIGAEAGRLLLAAKRGEKPTARILDLGFAIIRRATA
ncbi:MAG: LacI family DNA-binding transcriptional regulator [Thalassobaculum sp.]|uniref:LacI family DNA-binding transcriptional regulator n=2 Tax=Thalassobaculum sp. TaxID=2022740 RepID=UPI0032F00C06